MICPERTRIHLMLYYTPGTSCHHEKAYPSVNKNFLIESLNPTSALKKKKKSVRPSQDVKCESEVIIHSAVSLTTLKILMHCLLGGALGELWGCKGTQGAFSMAGIWRPEDNRVVQGFRPRWPCLSASALTWEPWWL